MFETSWDTVGNFLKICNCNLKFNINLVDNLRAEAKASYRAAQEKMDHGKQEKVYISNQCNLLWFKIILRFKLLHNWFKCDCYFYMYIFFYIHIYILHIYSAYMLYHHHVNNIPIILLSDQVMAFRRWSCYNMLLH